MTFKKMGCKATNLNVRPRFILKIIKRNSALVQEIGNIFDQNAFELKQGNYKDVLKTKQYAYSIEVHNMLKKFRKKRLYSKLQQIENIQVSLPIEVEYVPLEDGTVLSVSKTESYDTDLFDYLDEGNVIDLKQFAHQMSNTIHQIHQAGVFCIDFKPENVLLNTKDMNYFICDIDDSLMKHDFMSRQMLRRQKWVRTKGFEPGFGKPANLIEAIRVDLYALSLTIGRIQSHYINKIDYSVFTEPREGIMDEEFDDRYKISSQFKMSRFCANFMVRDLMYVGAIKNYHKNLLQCF